MAEENGMGPENDINPGNGENNSIEAETVAQAEADVHANMTAQAEMASQARSMRMAGNISSTMSNHDIGDGIAERRMNLLDAMREAEPQVGRRPAPEVDPWPRRKMFIRGIALGLLVCVLVAVLIIALAAMGVGGQLV